MRVFVFALGLILATPARADVQVEPLECPPTANETCVTAFKLKWFDAAGSRPVVVGDALVLVGTIDPYNASERLVALDVALDGGFDPTPILATTILDATKTEQEGYVEIAPDGRHYALFTYDERDDQNRNRTVGAIQFFDETGQRLGRVQAPYLAEWPDYEALEWSPVDVFGRYRGQNALRFDGQTMSLRFGRYLLSARLRDGAMTLSELTPATGDSDRLEDYANWIFDPVGYETLWVTPGLTGYFNEISDGNAAKLRIARPESTDPPDAFAYYSMEGTLLDPNPGREYSRSYSGLTISPDGGLLAVVRTDGNFECGQTQPYELRVYDTATGSMLWSLAGQSPVGTRRDLAWSRDNRLAFVEAFVPGNWCDQSTDEKPSGEVSVQVFDLRQAP